MNTAPKNLPLLIQAAIRAIATLPDLVVQGVFAVSSNRKQRMHKQRCINLQRLLSSLVRHSDIASGKLVRVYGKELYDVTVEDLTNETGVCRSSTCAMLGYLKALGLLIVSPQNRASMAFDNSKAQFSCSVHRSLSMKFWSLLGLDKEFTEQQERMDAHKVKHRCVIRGVDGVHKGHTLPIPSEDTPPPPRKQTSMYDHDALMESIAKARKAQSLCMESQS